MLTWLAVYRDGTSIEGLFPDQQPGDIPRDGMRSFQIVEGNSNDGWRPVATVDLGERERLVFRRRMRMGFFGGPASAVCLIVGAYNPDHDSYSLLYLAPDGSVSLKAATADVVAEPHEVGN